MLPGSVGSIALVARKTSGGSARDRVPWLGSERCRLGTVAVLVNLCRRREWRMIEAGPSSRAEDA